VLSTAPPLYVLTLRGPPQDIDLWVNALMDWGIGIMLGNQWNAWCTSTGWKGEGRDIGWLKAITIELAVITLQVTSWKDWYERIDLARLN
jgi:hypothetical protein